MKGSGVAGFWIRLEGRAKWFADEEDGVSQKTGPRLLPRVGAHVQVWNAITACDQGAGQA